MRKILLFVLCVCILFQTQVMAFSNEKEILKDLAIVEEKILAKTYKKDNIDQRLERLEMAVYGAIQNGCEYIRIKKIKKDVTNISSGGNGLGNNNKFYDLAGNSFGNYNFSVGNTKHYNNVYHNMDGYSHLLPHGHMHSHRLPPPPRYYSNSNPIINGDGTKNFSFGSKIHILDD